MATASPDPAEQFHDIELSSVPEYDSAEMAALDQALVTAMEQAVAAEEDTLAHLLRCEVGTLRSTDALGV